VSDGAAREPGVRGGVLAFEGPLSPPRKNGELQFAALWESRVFGLTMSLHEAGAFAWSEFQAELIAAIGAFERAHPSAGDDRYWERWLEAFETLAAKRRLLPPGALEARVATLAARPAGWDHAAPAS
jgi:nitrile hydratase accessory protein